MSLLIIVTGLLAIAGATQLSERIKVAPALLLLAGGIVVGYLPVVPAIEIAPQIILEGVLPPLLYATAVSIPTISFRRELAPVAILAVVLVALSAAVIGGVLSLVLTELSVAWAIAMGAVLSPTDAVAISIARRLGVTQRVITVLEGEGLLNDATALVVLASAVGAATAGDVSVGGVLSSFALAVVVAVVVGWFVGELTLHLRARVTDASVDTVITFTVPFLAAIPAEHMGGSGLVAAVVAGLVTGHRSSRLLPPAHRIAGAQTWRTVELVLEGFIFLVMGLQLFGVVEQVRTDGPSLATAVWLALLTGALTVVVRAAVVAPMLGWLARRGRRRARRWEEMAEPLRVFNQRCQAIARGEIPDDMLIPWDHERRGVRRRLRGLFKGRRRQTDPERFQARASQAIGRIQRIDADIAYYQDVPLGAREGAVIVWAGMRGAVTLAAAQTLPAQAPIRPFLLIVAILVAAGSLVIQGLTLPMLVRTVRPAMEGAPDEAQRRRLMGVLISAAQDSGAGLQGPAGLTGVSGPGREDLTDQDWAARRQRARRAHHEALDTVRAQRQALLDAADLGLYSADLVEYALTRLDLQEIALTSQTDPVERWADAGRQAHQAQPAT